MLYFDWTGCLHVHLYNFAIFPARFSIQTKCVLAIQSLNYEEGISLFLVLVHASEFFSQHLFERYFLFKNAV